MPAHDESSGSTELFSATLLEHGLGPLMRERVGTVQINVGKLCNQACQHCHVEAGPKRTEQMPAAVADRVLQLLEASPQVETVDITGGAPELNANFRRMVIRAHALGKRVIDRCNLTVLFEPGQEELAAFLAEHGVEIVASLPCYTEANVDRQRGRGVFDKSIRALQLFNELGYGREASPLRLDLVYNPLGASLPAPQHALEQDYKRQLGEQFGIEFHRLLTLANMPINRFAGMLQQTGEREAYQHLLVSSFNPHTVEHLMCRSLVSVGWNGRLYDCDFNQMLDMQMERDIWSIESFDRGWEGGAIQTAGHCFGCTAGAGSSCGGSLR